MENVGRKEIIEAAKKYNNWHKWGKDDQVGTLNYVTAEDIVSAAALIQKGKVFSLGLEFGTSGPQDGSYGRTNPVHTMTMTGADQIVNKTDRSVPYNFFADDYISMPVQCATHWDSLGHLFYEDQSLPCEDETHKKLYMYNGHNASNVNAYSGCSINGIEHTKNKMIGRGVMLDVASYKGVDVMPRGEGITCADLDGCAKVQGVDIKKGDFILIRTGHLGAWQGHWGSWCGGDAPGLEFETLEWFHTNKIAAFGIDTWGAEVLPNHSIEYFQPFHWIAIPILGITMGEMFVLDELATDCKADGRYDFFFAGPSLPITGATGGPVNPQAIK